MTQKLTNNASTTLTAAINSSDTTIQVTSVNKFPSLGAGDYFYGTLEDIAGGFEIVKVTAVEVNSFTVQRGQQGTTPRAFISGDKFELRVTAGCVQDVITTADAALPRTGGVVSGQLTLENSVALCGKTSEGNKASMMIMTGGNNVDIVNGGGSQIRFINKEYTLELVKVDNIGNMNVLGNLTSQGKTVVRTVNGANADANGNVNINVSGFVTLDCGHNNVGSFCFALNTSPSDMMPGATYAGSKLSPSGAQMNGTIPSSYGGLAGTWRCLGYAPYGGTTSRTATLFQRIS